MLNGRSYFARGILLCAALFSRLGHASEYTTLDCPGAQSTTAASINAAGMIVGTCATGADQSAFIRLPGGTYYTFYAPGAVGVTNAVDINDRGVLRQRCMRSVSCSRRYQRAPKSIGSPGVII